MEIPARSSRSPSRHPVHLYRPADLSVRRFVPRRRRSSSIGRWKGVHRVRHLRSALLVSDKARAHGEFDETHCAVLTVAFTGRPLSCDRTRSKTTDAGLPVFSPRPEPPPPRRPQARANCVRALVRAVRNRTPPRSPTVTAWTLRGGATLHPDVAQALCTGRSAHGAKHGKALVSPLLFPPRGKIADSFSAGVDHVGKSQAQSAKQAGSSRCLPGRGLGDRGQLYMHRHGDARREALR